MRYSPNKFLLSLVFISIWSAVIAQYETDEYYQQGELRYEDHIYKSGIRTVKLHPVGRDMDMPIIRLNSGEQLELSFDDLLADYMNMSYSIVHCNADWTPSALLKQEYIPGMQEAYIQQYAYSLNTLIPYTNYKLRIPNNDMRITKSGNYLLIIYVSGNESDLVLSRRFMVHEDKVSGGGIVKRASRVDMMNEWQEVDFTLSHPNYQIQDPFNDLKVHLYQDQRWDNVITDLKPQFMQNSQLIYHYDKENCFEGINEFRFFDLKNMQALSLNVRRINRDSVFTAYLKVDQPRGITKYAVRDDINGQYVIRRLDAGDSDSEADYIYVDFLLEYPVSIRESDVYVFGKLTDWRILPEYRMQYDEVRQAYRLKLPLKQGYYNFMYVLTDDNNQRAAPGILEGNHWETENSYQILIYNRQVGERYDRLVGFGELNSDDLY